MSDGIPDYNINEKVKELRSRYSNDVEFLKAARDEIAIKDSVSPLIFTEVMSRELMNSKEAAMAWPEVAKSISDEGNKYGQLVAAWASKTNQTYPTISSFLSQEDLTNPSKSAEFNENVKDFCGNYAHKGSNGLKAAIAEKFRNAYIDSINSNRSVEQTEPYGGDDFTKAVSSALENDVLTSQTYVDINETALEKRVFDIAGKVGAIPIDEYNLLLLDACAEEKLSPEECGKSLLKVLKEKDEDGKPLMSNSDVYYNISYLVTGGNYGGDYEIKNTIDEETCGNLIIESFKYNVDKDGDFVDALRGLQKEDFISSKTSQKVLQETAKYYTAEDYNRNLKYTSDLLSKDEILTASFKIFETKSTFEDNDDDGNNDLNEDDQINLKTEKLLNFYDYYYDEAALEGSDIKFGKEEYLNQIKIVATNDKSSKKVIMEKLLSKSEEFGKESINKCVDEMYSEGTISFNDKLTYDVLGTFVSENPIKTQEEFINGIKSIVADEEKRIELIEILKSDDSILHNGNLNSMEVLKSLKTCLDQKELVDIANSTYNEWGIETHFIDIYRNYGNNEILDKNIVFEECTKFLDENSDSQLALEQYKELCDELYKDGDIDRDTYKKSIKKIRDAQDSIPHLIGKVVSDEDYKKIIDDYSASIDKDVEENKITGKDAALLYKELLEEKSITEEEYKKKLLELYEKEKINSLELRDLSKSLSDVSDLDIDNKIRTQYKEGKISIPEPPPMVFETKTKDGKIIKHSFDSGDWYNKILNYRYEMDSTQSSTETIDVINSYGWNINKERENNNIPHCYAVEYRQLYNASITNILISLMGMITTGKHLVDNVLLAADNVIGSLTSAYKYIFGGADEEDADTKVTEINVEGSKENTDVTDGGMLSSARQKINSALNAVTNKTSEILSLVGNMGESPVSNSEILSPYRLMYILKSTGKKYCFPMMDKSSSSFRASNKMDEKEGGEGSKLLGNAIFSTIGNVTRSIMGLAQDLEQIAPFLSGSSSVNENRNTKEYSIERSKFFSFPTDGEEIETTFMFYNTTSKDIWKKHYSFILGFTLRNLPYKQDMVSYYPPLFYDVIVPGIKRCPYCYVDNFDVSPLGITRKLTLRGEELGFNEDKIKDTQYQINVPEAWMLKIKFKSLLATSANQILSSLIDAPISAEITNDGLNVNLHDNAQMNYMNTMA